MAELATIARPYADALFKASTQQGADLSGTVAWAEELAAIAANPQLRQLADDPKVTDEQLFDVISGVAGSALPDAARNFLRVIIENGRLQALPEVAAQFRSLVNRAGGSSDAVVQSALPIDAAALDRKSTRLNSSHSQISYAVFCLKKKKHTNNPLSPLQLVDTLLMADAQFTYARTHI